MKLRELYHQNTVRSILLRGLLGLSTALLFGAVYSAFTGRNEIVRFAFPIFGVPTTLTIANLLFFRSDATPSPKINRGTDSESQQ